jgi:hypothetical protein
MTRTVCAWIAAASIVAVAPLGTCLASAADATGTWTWSFTGQDGQTRQTTLKLKQDGEKLTGTITGRNNTETDIEDGKVEGDKVSFKVTREFNGNKFVMKYQGMLKDDTIKGTTEFERDGETRSRDWEAKRSESK